MLDARIGWSTADCSTVINYSTHLSRCVFLRNGCPYTVYREKICKRASGISRYLEWYNNTTLNLVAGETMVSSTVQTHGATSGLAEYYGSRLTGPTEASH